MRSQLRMSGEERQETRLEGKKTSEQEGSSARLKGSGMVLRAWGEEPPGYHVEGALAWGGAESGSPARRQLQSPAEKWT